jgi:hypothetical protein
MMMSDVVGVVVDQVLMGAKKATKYISPGEVVKATYQGKRRKNSRTHTVVVTVGAPNYLERVFIKKAQKAGEPFPVKKIQLKIDKKAVSTNG